ncbi:MAG: (Fe-S)-binding protein [Candidatus Heimdallarchaeota archaeon]
MFFLDILAKETRETFFEFGDLTSLVKWGIFYPMTFVVTVIFIIGFLRLARVWYQGQNAIPLWKLPFVLLRRIFVWKRTKTATGSKILQRGAYSWIMHTSMMVGFLGLVLVTTLLSIHEWLFDHELLVDGIYFWWSIAGEIFGILFIIGTIMALLRRYIFQKDSFTEAKTVDSLILWLFLLLGISGFLAEALRLAALSQKPDGIPDFEIAGFVGYFLAIPFEGLDYDLLRFLIQVNWFFHVILAGILLVYLPYSKLAHMIIGGMHILLASDTPPGTVDFPEEGISKINDLTFQQLISLDACLECHRCHNACPATRSEEHLSPMLLIKDLQYAAHSAYGLRSVLSTMRPSQKSNPLQKSIHGSYGRKGITPEVLWACTTCRACVYECPVSIDHLDLIVGLRAHLVEEGQLSGKPLTDALDSIVENGNIWGQPKRDRPNWLKRLDFEIPHVKETTSKILWYVGDTASFDPRGQQSAIAFAKILKAANIEFGILGKDEAHDGDSSRRLGEAALLEMMAKKNLKKFRKLGVKKIICTSPHAYNTFKNEYPAIGASDAEVVHYTQFLADLISAGKLKFTEKVEPKRRVTFHDPCYLSRYNNEIKTVRKVLRALPSVEVFEMEDHGKQSMCCGGGGGGMFRETNVDFRVSELRVLQVLQTPARDIVTVCPYCLNMLTDATKTIVDKVDHEILGEAPLNALDLAELILEAMKI